ncbi:MAG TPA: ABC transporter permease [Thermoanaerobaculia bacterium]|nr:ABC transporter permease [Thermoanaerobaculia bacterium]
MSDWRQLLARSELRFAARRLRRVPAFAGAVVLVLALGVGTTTAMFSLVNGILLAPLPYPEPDRLVRLTHTASSAGRATVDLSDAIVMLYQSETRAFDGVAAWRFDDGDLGPSEADQTVVRVRGARVTANFFDVLGVPPARGRAFAPGADRPGAPRVVVLSHRIWQERLHGDPDAIGRQIDVNDVPRTIVGIMPPRFAYPARQVELWLPLALDPARTRPASLNLTGIGRLKGGVSSEAARADLARVLTNPGAYFQGDASAATWQETHTAPHVQSLRDSIVGPPSQLLWFVFGSVLLVLLVACTNVAGLLLVRAERAQMELAVRAALGSGFMGILALTLSESVLLSALGGGTGVLLAVASMRVVRSTGTALSLPRLEDVGVDAPVLLFALGITVFCALFVSVLPLLRARRVSIVQVLRRAGTGPAGSRAPQRVRSALVVSQIALAVVLVTSSGLMTRSLLRLHDVRPGFEADHVVTSRVLLPYARYSGGSVRLNFFQAMVREAQAIPGARDVALTDWVPLSGDRHDMAIDVEGDASQANAGGTEHAVAHVDGQYFQALRIPLFRGRTFGAQDAAHPVDEAIVSHAFAERYWPGTTPLGKRVRPLGGRWYTIVGEVGDVRYDGLEKPPSETVYFPIVTAGPEETDVSLPAALSLVVRTDAGEGEALSAIRRIVRALDSGIPTYDEGSLQQLVHDASARARALAVLLAIASVVTLFLGAVGLYGIMAYSVSIRRRELGIRMALGARPEDVSRMISLDGLRLAGLGIVIGTACALATSRLLRGLLYAVAPTDLLTLSATPVALLFVAFIASWLPARRAAAVSPAEALQSQ